MGDAVTGVQHDAGGAPGGVQGEHGLDGHVHGGHVEGLEHDLGHLLPVGLGVEGRLGQQHRVLLGRDAQLVVEGVVPDLLHVVPAARTGGTSAKPAPSTSCMSSEFQIQDTGGKSEGSRSHAICAVGLAVELWRAHANLDSMHCTSGQQWTFFWDNNNASLSSVIGADNAERAGYPHQLVTMPCSIGYLRVRMPRLD